MSVSWLRRRKPTIVSLNSRTQLQAQQQQIAVLEQQLLVAANQDADAARTEVMRQQIREILSEQEFRESLMPSILQAGYDEGFFIRSSDDNFLMKINGLIQFRWTHYGTQSQNRYLNPRLHRNDRTGFDVQRIRLALSGHVYSPDLTYHIEFGADSPNGYDLVSDEVWVNYRMQEELQFRSGLLRLASTRAQMLDDDKLQMVDRPMTDAVFGLGYGVGVRFWGNLFDKKLTYYLDIVNSVSDGEGVAAGRTITTDPAELDNNPAILFRAVWHALGDEHMEFESQSDLAFSPTPGLDIGFSYMFNEDEYDAITTRIPYPLPRRLRNQGGYGLVSTNGAQINQFGFDAAFKYQGFSATGEYILRMVDPRRAGRRPFTAWWLFSNQDKTTVQQGAYVQLGYFLPIPGMEKKLEAVARVGGISALAEEQEGSWEYSFGMNYYLQGDKVKLQADVTKIYEVPISNPYYSLANVNDDALIFRVQLQVAF